MDIDGFPHTRTQYQYLAGSGNVGTDSKSTVVAPLQRGP